MNWRAWWQAWLDIFHDKPLKPPSEPKRDNGYLPPKPCETFIPPHSHTEDHPKWPKDTP